MGWFFNFEYLGRLFIQPPGHHRAAWREGSIADHERKIFLRPLLPMIDPAKQKYHLQFWFHPGDSLDLKVDVLDIGDCRHTHGIGATRTPQHGPCGVMNDW